MRRRYARLVPTIEMAVLHTPIGPLTLAVREGCVCTLHFEDRRRPLSAGFARKDPSVTIRETADPGGFARTLRSYFKGEIDALDDIPVEMEGTPFQQQVWRALRTVRAGHTASYSDIARRIGMPAAVRAVGAANGANPVAVIVPCHRIIGSSGSLTGYGGGLQRKRWLLEHEGVLLRM
jgi:methylated-DNA-[protein]-cysteine S-methyltransferase